MTLEIGNMVFGNSRGEHEVDRSLQDEFCSLLGQMGFDGYGYHQLCDDDGVYQNETFLVRPYYWGDCQCGYEAREYEWCKAHSHNEECYQSEVRQGLVKAGGIADAEWGFVTRPAHISYDDWRAIEGGIYDDLCAKHELDRRYGCAVHCTCAYQKLWESWANGNDHAETCPLVQPNFWHKSSGFKLKWYKYPLRDSYSSTPLTQDLMRSMFADCIASMTTQGIDAGTGETRQGLDAKHESPVGEADAPEAIRGEVLTGYGEE